MALGDEDDVGACAACCAMGAFDIIVAPLTQTSMPLPEPTIEYREQTAPTREHLENAGRERSILAGRPI
jgi:hypothetical protein